MKLRVKVFLVVLPLIIVTLSLAETASYFHAVNGVTRLAKQLLGFKLEELEKYAENQWELLVENDYAGRPDMAAAAKAAVEMYARTIILSDTEVIFALDTQGNTVMASSPLEISPDEGAALLNQLKTGERVLLSSVIGGEKRALQAFFFTPFQWYVVISEKDEVFYRDANRITSQTFITLGGAIVFAVILLLFAARRLTRPLDTIVSAMNAIIESPDLSSRVEVEYQDETGRLASTFNAMLGELDLAYGQIKRYAFDAALAGKKEERIRHIFQKYVPKDVIEQFFMSPEKMLTGANRELAILFSDIRSFTTISEGMNPGDLVNSLNRYFSGQVDVIMNRNGIVDKYIGDAVMAFWGAPRQRDDDALQSVLAALDMLRILEDFNARQRRLNKPEFRIGVGVNYGEVTVGNIGSERKMDYTVIGDPVNLASRLEGLTKTYHAEILISEGLYAELHTPASAPEVRAQGLRFRLLDTVAVKGKSRGVKIFTVKRSLSPAEETAWPLHNQGMELYYRRSFLDGAAKFREVLALLPGDFNSENLLNRCTAYTANPPPKDWDGVEVMKTK
ncbi:MAG: HAMP domain-containing protein [Spirochaetaceae bacterium]|jgi:class 3 adenylate cyclase/HAMP domain-containing protein|nr:HAMP domain-containing protein [Spirochaetaceae bacterium]